LGKKPHKRITFGASVEAQKKQARASADPSSIGRARPVWRVSSIDWGGPFGWSGLSDPGLLRELIERLRAFESMSWTSVEQSSGSHNVAVDRLCKEARDRLADLQQDDIDELFSLRITGRRRAWGFREAEVLRFLWWDPEHKVCPSLKD
jgi:hypothetical protein